MKAFIILSHGSRKKESNQEIISLVKDIEQRLGQQFSMTTHAFVQFAKPGFEEQVEDLVQRGATTIVVFPFFISAGGHVQNDVPELVNAAKSRHPDIDFRVMDHLGKIEGVRDVIAKEAVSSLESS